MQQQFGNRSKRRLRHRPVCGGCQTGCLLYTSAYLLFHKLLKHNPADARWADRDRFVLSNGHASALLYGTLFLSGYDVTLEDLKSFRQWGSRTPGHPERGHTDGVEVTTGPLRCV